MRPSAACALFLSHLGLLAVIGPASVLAQQSPPLSGQGVDPILDGVSPNTLDSVTGVFMSIELTKLLSIDEQDYTFDAIITVQQTWTDPRAKATWALIDSQNRVYQDSSNRSTLSDDVQSCYDSRNRSSPSCQAAFSGAPPCNKYCSTYGTTTDNPYLCCDLIWIPAMQLRNLIYTSQDRVVQDVIFPFQNPNATGDEDAIAVHRETAVYGHFSAPMQFQDYPFDRQVLQVFIGPALNPISQNIGLLTYVIQPSATFRRSNQAFRPGPNFTGEVQGINRDELGKWNIDSVSFTCGEINTTSSGRSKGGIPVYEQTQPFASDDLYSLLLANLSKSFDLTIDLNNQLLQTCALTIMVSRLSSTLVVQSVVPVAFVGALAFVIFFASPDAVDFRVGTEVSLFLALTAMQFIFVSQLPLASYLTKLDIFILLTYCTIVVLVAESLLAYSVCTRVEHLSRAGKYSGASQREQKLLQKHEGQQQQEEGREQDGLQQGEAETHTRGKGQQEAQQQEDGRPLKEDKEENLGLDGEQNKDSGEWDPDGARPMLGESGERGGRVHGNGQHARVGLGRFKLNVLDSFMYRGQDVLAKDPAYAYDLACRIDRITGVILFLLYVLLSALCLTVGLA